MLLKDRLAEKIRESGMTIAELERKAGLKIHAVRNIVKGRSKKPSAETLQKISSALGCNINQLIGNNAVPLPHDLKEEIWDAQLYGDCVETINHILAKMQKKITLRQAFELVLEVYGYAVQEKENRANKGFATWLLRKKFL